MLALTCGLAMLAMIGFTVWSNTEPSFEADEPARAPASETP